ncbi:MAG: aminopeptidase [Firmicutes bacterium]|nr:aminopeptidase [Bacillota bacterium]
MGLSAGEPTLIVTDTDRLDVGKALFEAAGSLGADAVMTVMKPRLVNGEEPPPGVAAAMAASRVVLCPTSKSLTHTQARAAAARTGSRIATMPGITPDMLYEGAMTADYRKVSDLTLKVAGLLTNATSARIVYEGRVLSMSLAGRKAVASTGRFLNPGESGNLPSGEAYIAPVEGTADGEMWVDGSVAGLGKVQGPLLVSIQRGTASSFSGWGARELERMLATPDARNVAELGIGTNDRARLTGTVLEDEKIYGSVHIAFGDNSTFGGTVKAGIHIDCIMLRPDLYLDDRLVIRAGEFVA